ncbi:MAG: putative membrane protein YedE/YeeE [Gammaproteobacteria bacterium]|jgi:uncharacterized membrane protein YedE/YeeE
MRSLIAATLSGLLFGFGLSISEMTNRQRVLGFLDVTGNWDASLIFVMGGAVLVTVITFRFILKRTNPVLGDKFHLPLTKSLDIKLLGGAAIFGIGWGIAGYCPGPAISALSSLSANPLVFFLFFIAGSYSAHRVLTSAS